MIKFSKPASTSVVSVQRLNARRRQRELPGFLTISQRPSAPAGRLVCEIPGLLAGWRRPGQAAARAVAAARPARRRLQPGQVRAETEMRTAGERQVPARVHPVARRTGPGRGTSPDPGSRPPATRSPDRPPRPRSAQLGPAVAYRSTTAAAGSSRSDSSTAAVSRSGSARTSRSWSGLSSRCRPRSRSCLLWSRYRRTSARPRWTPPRAGQAVTAAGRPRCRSRSAGIGRLNARAARPTVRRTPSPRRRPSAGGFPPLRGGGGHDRRVPGQDAVPGWSSRPKGGPSPPRPAVRPTARRSSPAPSRLTRRPADRLAPDERRQPLPHRRGAERAGERPPGAARALPRPARACSARPPARSRTADHPR